MDRKNTALLVIDMLKDFVEKDGSLYVANSEEIIPNIRKIKEYFWGVAVHINDCHAENDPEFDIFPKHCVAGSVGAEIVDELSFEDDSSLVIYKQGYSGFGSRELHIYLNEGWNVNTLLVTGVCTEYCVLETVKDAIRIGYNVFVVRDAIKGLTEEAESMAIKEMEEMGAKFVTTEEIIGN